MQVSCLKRISNMVAGAQGDTLEFVKSYQSKIVSNGVGVLHLGAAGRRAWLRIWEGPRTLHIIYAKWQDKSTTARLGNYTCEHPTAASGDSLDPIDNICSCHRPAQDKSSHSMYPESTDVQHLEYNQTTVARWPSRIPCSCHSLFVFV